ncbi:MAG: hypothetical protein AB1512_08115 [Thermodesulfobacteriota bacterium]
MVNAKDRSEPSSVRSIKASSYALLSITMMCLVFSVYCGWNAHSVISGQLLSKKTLEVMIDPTVTLKLMRYAYFQYAYFMVALVSIGFCFILNLISLFRKSDFSQPLFACVFVVIVLATVWLVIFLVNRHHEYTETCKNVDITEVKSEPKSKETVEGTQPSRTRPKYGETLLKEMISATKDMVTLLINWAILLLTGLGYVMFRMMKFIT